MVTTGLQQFMDNYPSYRSRKGALVVNQSSVDQHLQYSWDVLINAGYALVRIFSPEHGLFGEEQDQVASPHGEISSLPIISLYGTTEDSLIPAGQYLEDLDYILFDIQDVGSRYYTFLQTLVLLVRALSGKGIELVVCDRPNPLDGMTIEGPSLDRNFFSFVGLMDIPVRHGLTAGEMALLARHESNSDIAITVVTMAGWKRDMYFDDSQLTWIPPSPNMPLPETALVYPGACLVEGTSLSEGRGTTRPFEILGGPVGQDRAWETSWSHPLEGAVLRPVTFRPSFNKHTGTLCQGYWVHVTDRSLFQPFRFYSLLIAHMESVVEGFSFTMGVYEFVSDRLAFDLLAGSSELRECIVQGSDPRDLFPRWQENEKLFRERRKPFLLYHEV